MTATDLIERTMLDRALELAGLGVPVFPLKPRDKTPLTTGGFKQATVDRGLVEQAWKRWPDANIGIATGGPLRLLVADVDGPAGQAFLAHLEKHHGALPETRASTTGKGRHLLFVVPEGRPLPRCSAGDGLDIRCEGGYIVGPGSIHPNGRQYAWANSAPVAVAPEWLIGFADNRKAVLATLDGAENVVPFPSAEKLAPAAPTHMTIGAAANVSPPEIYSATAAERLRSALAFIDPAPRDNWLKVLMALHSTGWGAKAREIADDWSRQSAKFNEADQDKTWTSFDRGYDGVSVTLGTIYAMAKEAGWTPPPRALPANVEDEGEPPAEIAELNERFFLIPVGAKIMVGSYGADSLGHSSLHFRNPQDFQTELNNRKVWIGDKPQPLGTAWLKHPARRGYEGFGFDAKGPRDLSNGKLNLWRGLGIEPKLGEWPLLRKHIHEVLAAGDAGHASYILGWLAWKLQHPGELPETALVFKSRQGVGKGLVFNMLVRAFGSHGLAVRNPKHVVGNFNGHLRGACLLLLDEAFWAGDKAARGTLFGLISEPQMTLEAKGVDVTTEPNRLGMILLTNKDWAIPAEADSRRFAVFECADTYAYNVAPDVERNRYFRALAAEIDGGGFAAMLFDLLALDLKNWHPRQALPRTKALQEQQAQSLEGYDAWWCDVLTTGSLPRDPRAAPPVGEARYMFLTRDAVEDARRLLGPRAHVSDNTLGKYLTKSGLRSTMNSAGLSRRKVGTLAECRAAWAKRFGGTIQDWFGDDGADDWS